MLVRHHQCPSNVPIQHAFASLQLVVQPHEPRTDAVAECDDGVEGGPVFICFRDLRVVLGENGLAKVRKRKVESDVHDSGLDRRRGDRCLSIARKSISRSSEKRKRENDLPRRYSKNTLAHSVALQLPWRAAYPRT